MTDRRQEAAVRRDRELARQSWEAMDRDDLLRELEHTESEREAWERHGQTETFARERAERDAGIVIDNRNSQLCVLSERLAAKETALQRIMDAVSLQEAVRIAREAIRVV